MQNKQDLYNQFERIQPDPLTKDWNKSLHKKWTQAQQQQLSSATSKWIILSVTLLIGLNVLALSSTIFNTKQTAKMNRTKAVAGQFLISTSSSKF